MPYDPQFLLNQGWVGFLVGVLSLVLAIVLYRRGRRKGRLATEWVGTPLLGYQHANALPPAVTIHYDRTPVPRVGFTDVLLWNAGGDVLRGEDVVSRSPLRVEVPDGSLILEAGVVSATRDTSGWDVHIDPGHPHIVRITFDYAEPGDAVRLRVVHTGADLALPVRGDLRGMPDGILQLGHAQLPYTGWRVAVAKAWHEEHLLWRVLRLAGLLVPVVLPVLLAGVVTWALWVVWRSPVKPTPAAHTVALVARALAALLGVITYGLTAAIVGRHLGRRGGVWGPPSLLYGVQGQRSPWSVDSGPPPDPTPAGPSMPAVEIRRKR